MITEAVAAAKKIPPKIFTGLTLSGQERAVRRLTATEARRRCAVLAIGIERYPLLHGGKLPATLEEMTRTDTPAVQVDPFDGKSLRYRALPKGYVVYSVGPDRQDQQGATVAPKGQPDAFDVSFTVEQE